MRKLYYHLIKISILLVDIVLHAGLFSPLLMLWGYLPLLSIVFYPFCLFLERKYLGCTFAELLINKKFIIYPSPKTLLRTPVFIKIPISKRRRGVLKILLPITALLVFILAEPLDTFATSSPQNIQTTLLEELHCSVVQPSEGKLSKGVLKLPRNGGNLPYTLYKIDDKSQRITYMVQNSAMHSDWTRYPYSIVMKGAVYVILEDVRLDKVNSKEVGTHQGNKSTVIRGIKNGEAQLIRIVLANKQIYKVQVSYPLNDSEIEQKAIDFIDSFTPIPR